MSYRVEMLKRKEYFGLIWSASHCPSKLSKVEILQIDLTKKCDALKAYIVNGLKKGKNTPKLSLMVSAHLMKGLVIILHKKNTYLYDEMLYLKDQIKKSYFHIETKKLRSKTPKKLKTSDKAAITLPENYPDLNNMTSLDTMVKCLNKTVSTVHYKSITLADSDDVINNSTTIPIDYDFDMDMFGKSAGTFLMPQVDDYSIAGINDQNYQTFLGNDLLVQKPSVTSTGRKPDIERAPFGNITNIQSEQVRNELGTIGQLNTQTNLAFEETGNVETRIEMPFTDNLPAFPALYETTVMEPQTLLPPAELEVSKVYDEEMPEEPAVRGMTKTYSADIIALKEQKLKKMQTIINRKRKHMTVDIKTTLPTVSGDEREKRLKTIQRPGSQEYREYLEERTRNFQEACRFTSNDFNCLDTIREPMCLLSKRTEYLLDKRQKDSMLYVQLVNKIGSLTSGEQIDDTHFYLTHAKDLRAQAEASELPSEVPIVEMMRKADKSDEPAGISKSESITKKKRDSTLLQQTKVNRTSMMGATIVDENLPIDSMQMEPLPPMMPIDEIMPNIANETSLDKPKIQINSESIDEEGKLQEADIYEALIIDSVAENEDVILQELIQSSQVPEKCNGRKMLAVKMFRACLNLAGKRAISISQAKAYDSIKLNLVEN